MNKSENSSTWKDRAFIVGEITLWVGMLYGAFLVGAHPGWACSDGQMYGSMQCVEGRWVNSAGGNIYGDSRVNPAADPTVNPQADPSINWKADPLVSPDADPFVNPMADPDIAPIGSYRHDAYFPY